jgi:acyl dehydratase
MLNYEIRHTDGRASAVGITTIRRAEVRDGETSLTAANNLAIRRALEEAGVNFVEENGGGAGVRFSKPVRAPDRSDR